MQYDLLFVISNGFVYKSFDDEIYSFGYFNSVKKSIHF